MFKSIRTNLFASFIALMGLFLVSVLVINAFFLDDIFIFGSRKAMERTAATLTEAVKDGTFSEETLAEASFRSGLFIAMLSKNGVIVYNAGLPRIKTPIPDPEHLDAVKPLTMDLNLTEESRLLLDRFQRDQTDVQAFYIEKGKGPRQSVILMQRLEQGEILLLTKPFSPLKESSQLATIFILLSGAVILIIGSIGVFVFSGRITAPILNLDRVARKMASLDFSESVVISSRDELGALGSSVQAMSENLHRTLDELKAANGKLRLEIDREREIDLQRRRFVSQISHELRTPLSMIQGYADGLQYGVVEGPEDIKEYCEVIVDETKKMSELIRDMLDLSCYEAGAFTYAMADFDLAQLVRGTASRLDTITVSGESVLTVTGPDTCMVYGDSGRIGQILANLIGNAKSHGLFGEAVQVAYGDEDGDHFLEVANHGPLIPADELTRIWEPFYKAAAGAPSRGAGLGLAIVKTIAEAHGGYCVAENTETGTRFRFIWSSQALKRS